MEAARPWRVALACALGTSHVATDTPCQDSASQQIIETEEGSVLVAVVCDGAGSAAFAERGSKLAADIFVRCVVRYFGEGGDLKAISREIAEAWVTETATHVRQLAANERNDEREYSCTLLGAIVGEREAAFLQVGDGAIVYSESADNGWAWAFWPQHGDFANTTNFIIMPEAVELMEFGNSPCRVEELAMFSDGIEHLVLNNATKQVHAAFFDAMFPPVRKADAGFDAKLSQDLETYLLSPRITDKTDDDKTLILATRRVPTPTPDNADG